MNRVLESISHTIKCQTDAIDRTWSIGQTVYSDVLIFLCKLYKTMLENYKYLMEKTKISIILGIQFGIKGKTGPTNSNNHR